MTPPLLEVRNLVKHYDSRRGLWGRITGNPGVLVQAVNGVSLSIQRGETLARLADNARAIHGDVIETDLRRLLPIHRGIRPDIEAIAVGGHGKQRDAVFIVLRARNPGGNDQQLGIAAVENDTFLATEYPAVAVRRSRGPDVGDIVATLWLRVRESGLQLTGDDRL